MWNFDEVINREDTNCTKYDERTDKFGRNDVIPMWIADMDFRTPDFIIEAIRNRLDHEILGYSFRPESYFDAFISWVYSLHHWEVKRDWIVFSPGVVPALNLCTLAYTTKGDEIIIQPPVYPPFHAAVRDHERKIVYNHLLETDKGWIMDFEGLCELITPATKMIILSNPHNPVGRVWKREELSRLVDICYEKEIVILSDEIHSDIMMYGNRHVPVASLSEKAAKITVTCMAPSKTFNLAGLTTSSMIIPEKILREKFWNTLHGIHIHLGNIFGNVASEAAYTYGHEWLNQMIGYVGRNIDLVVRFCNQHLPLIKPVIPEATYMVWLDCRKMNMSGKELQRFFVEEAGVGMNEGSDFGPGGEGFMRMNVACPESVVKQALERIEKALKSKN